MTDVALCRSLQLALGHFVGAKSPNPVAKTLESLLITCHVQCLRFADGLAKVIHGPNVSRLCMSYALLNAVVAHLYVDPSHVTPRRP